MFVHELIHVLQHLIQQRNYRLRNGYHKRWEYDAIHGGNHRGIRYPGENQFRARWGLEERTSHFSHPVRSLEHIDLSRLSKQAKLAWIENWAKEFYRGEVETSADQRRLAFDGCSVGRHFPIERFLRAQEIREEDIFNTPINAYPYLKMFYTDAIIRGLCDERLYEGFTREEALQSKVGFLETQVSPRVVAYMVVKPSLFFQSENVFARHLMPEMRRRSALQTLTSLNIDLRSILLEWGEELDPDAGDLFQVEGVGAGS